MSSVNGPKPKPEENAKPPKRNWEATRKERFFDLKFSHYVELILTAILVGVGYLQFEVYTRQAGIMEQQTIISQAEHRPWVSANPIELVGDMIHNDFGLEMTIQFTLKNTGHSPARRAFPGAISLLNYSVANASEKVCDDAGKGWNGLAIFPGDTVVQRIGIGIVEAEFTSFKEEIAKNNGGKVPEILPPIIACIAYQDMESEKFHHTPYDFFLSLPNGHGSPLPMMLNHGTIHNGDVILVSLPVTPPPN